MRNHDRDQRGFALILTLWIIGALTLMLFAFSSTARSNSRATLYIKEEVRAQQEARSAVHLVMGKLHVWHKQDSTEEKLRRIQGEWLGDYAVDVNSGQVAKISKKDPPDLQDKVIVRVRCEESKFPLFRSSVAILNQLSPSTPALNERVVDYIKRHRGKEANINNDSLLRIEGMSSAFMHGTDKRAGAAELMTLQSKGKIYINGSDQAVLQLIPGVDRELAREFQLHLEKKKHFQRIEDLQHVIGVTPPIYQNLKKWITVQPQSFSIEAVANFRQIERRWRSVLHLGDKDVRVLSSREG